MDEKPCLDPECDNVRLPHFHRVFILPTPPKSATRLAKEYNYSRRRHAISEAQSRECDGYRCDYAESSQ